MRNWDVYYCLGFETEIEGEPSGKEFPINQSFVWDNETWRILSMYDFDNGPVFDLCKKVDFERSLKYHIKWDSSKPYLKDFPREKLEERQKDCPFGDNFDSAVTVGNCTLEYKACYSVCFDCASSTPPAESDASCKTVRHYGLDEDTVWAFRRIAFAWPDGGKPDFLKEKIQIALTPRFTPLYGDSIAVKDRGEYEAVHPLTREKYTITVKDLEWHEADFSDFEDGYEHPHNALALTYTMEPDLPQDIFFLKDRGDGDFPRLIDRGKAKLYPTATNHFGFIPAGGDGELLHCDTSALYFSTEQKIQWRPVFMEKLKTDIKVTFEIA